MYSVENIAPTEDPTKIVVVGGHSIRAIHSAQNGGEKVGLSTNPCRGFYTPLLERA